MSNTGFVRSCKVCRNDLRQREGLGFLDLVYKTSVQTILKAWGGTTNNVQLFCVIFVIGLKLNKHTRVSCKVVEVFLSHAVISTRESYAVPSEGPEITTIQYCFFFSLVPYISKFFDLYLMILTVQDEILKLFAVLCYFKFLPTRSFTVNCVPHFYSFH